MAFFWKMKSVKNAFPFCLNLTEREEQLIIIGYRMAQLHGQGACFWMSHIEEYFFNNANALSLTDLCNLNFWLEENDMSECCYIPYITENPSLSLDDRHEFSVRRDEFLAAIEPQTIETLKHIAIQIAQDVNLHLNEIPATNEQIEGLEAYEICINTIAEKNGDQMMNEDDEKEVNQNDPHPLLPELIDQDDFIIGKEIDEPVTPTEQGEVKDEVKTDTVDDVIAFLSELGHVVGYDKINQHIKTLQKLKEGV